MYMRLKHFCSAIGAALILLPNTGGAAITGTWMEDFYSSAGASINVTPGGVYSTQTTNVISGGGFVARVPRKNVQLLSVTPPGLKTGCGGIDFWAGSFGFINKEQLVAFLRNIGQNSLGLFFQLALKSMAPEVAATIEVMQDWAQRMNQFNMNSCQASTALVNENNLSFLASTDAEQRASAFKVSLGASADKFLANFSVKSDLAEVYAANDSAKTAAPNQFNNTPQEALSGNAIWQILKKVPDISNREKILIMSLIGTHIPEKVTDDLGDTTTKSKSYPGIINIIDLLGNRTGSTTKKMYSCGADTTNCLILTTPNETYDGFSRIAYKAMTGIRSNIINRVAQNTTDLQLLNMTTLPVYRMIATATASKYPFISQIAIERYADLVGLEMALGYLDYLSSEVRRQMAVEAKNQTSAYALLLADIERNIAQNLEQGNRLRMEKLADRGALMANIGEIENFERALYSNLSSNLAASLRFGKKM